MYNTDQSLNHQSASTYLPTTESHMVSSVTYFLEKPGQGGNHCLGSFSVALKVGTRFSRSTALWHFLFPSVSSGPWIIHSLAPLLEWWHHDAGPFLSCFTMKSGGAQWSISLGRPLDSTRCLRWQPWHHGHQLCSQGHCLWRSSHAFFSATWIWVQ